MPSGTWTSYRDVGVWEQQGGRADETSRFPMLDTGTPSQPHLLWPLALYPVTGATEVVFQCLKDRSPFDDAEIGRELLRRFDEIDGIELAEANWTSARPSRSRCSPTTRRRSARCWSSRSAPEPDCCAAEPS
ncbi:hypothetical protein ACIG0C_31310 [Kitasatospora aureofaciens]|uniref:Uncharacterized protein n=1 Tax=Kitasatospora aureofaciens TaxID=1894 RepID=A0A1E7N072_KITAU|nr:hypothetical protein [Kitasatospora aureofaciens]QEU99139.1 hypothetical protein CP971_07365 [Streptomyces viridifaciens]ARF77941.1 hypothetical protein B6264_02485 [Kitasatospora aureofaciens]OEV34082.1 hypothetical protein HS99_0011630 [Kitasatospora aureofaciens]UKZ05182.1 hypothetical protein BOQ63_014220 [Streptomyces viridifaciens]GGU72563.1 hypothetical protein GCM10010502_25190 [Kitasatospora aureofaciens]